jgi:hypothetical protein
MRLLLPLALFLTTTSAFAQNKPSGSADILAAENLAWANYVAGDTVALGKQYAPDFIDVEQEIQTGPQVLSFLKTFHEHCSLAPVKILDPQVRFLTPTIATIVYHATETPTCGNKSMSGETNISTVWVLVDGHWLMHLHTEYAVTSQP